MRIGKGLGRNGASGWGALLLAAVLGLTGCASSQGSAGDERETRARDSVQADDLRGRNITHIQQMLRGQVAGVEVLDTPRGLVIRVRGASAFQSSVEPLFVIDGLPIQAGIDGALTGLNPADVASIRVLKNASDTAAYGVRGANGVVLITTKKAPVPDGE